MKGTGRIAAGESPHVFWNPQGVIHGTTDAATARFIVKACNAHDGLVAEVKTLLARVESLELAAREVYSTLYAADVPNQHAPVYRDAISAARLQISDALAIKRTER
jgi:hypothetical protein